MPLLRNADKTQDQQAQEPGLDQLLPRRRHPAAGAAQLPRHHGLVVRRRPREVHARRRWSTCSRGTASRSAARSSTSTSCTWLNEQYIHELTLEQLADALIAWRLNKELPRQAPAARRASASSASTSSSRSPTYFFAGDLDYAPVLPSMVVPDVAPAGARRGAARSSSSSSRRATAGTREMLEEVTAAWVDGAWLEEQARVHAAARRRSPAARRRRRLFDTMAVLGKEITRRRLRTRRRADQRPAPPPAPQACEELPKRRWLRDASEPVVAPPTVVEAQLDPVSHRSSSGARSTPTRSARAAAGRRDVSVKV